MIFVHVRAVQPTRQPDPSAPDLRSDLVGWAGYGHDTSHHRFYWGTKLMLMVTAEGTVTAFGLANPKLVGEPDQVLAMVAHDKNRRIAGTTIVCDKGFAGADFEATLAGNGCTVVRPARTRARPRPVPELATQRVEAIIRTLKANCTLKTTADASPPGYGPVSCNASSPSMP